MGKRCISNENLSTTGFSYTLSLINGKYKMTILYTLMEFGVVRFNEIKKYIGQISYKTLSSTLKELEADQLVHREEYPQIPPKVEYSLTERGKSLIPTWTECANGATKTGFDKPVFVLNSIHHQKYHIASIISLYFSSTFSSINLKAGIYFPRIISTRRFAASPSYI